MTNHDLDRLTATIRLGIKPWLDRLATSQPEPWASIKRGFLAAHNGAQVHIYMFSDDFDALVKLDPHWYAGMSDTQSVTEILRLMEEAWNAKAMPC